MDMYSHPVIDLGNGIAETLHLDYAVSMKELILGAEKTQLLHIDNLAAWEQPTVRLHVPPGSRPEDIIKIPNGWAGKDENCAFDILVTLHLSTSSPYSIIEDDVFLRIPITNRNGKVRKKRIEFPDGEIRDVEINKVVKKSLLLRFDGRGMPIRRRKSFKNRGDFFVSLQPCVKANRKGFFRFKLPMKR